MDKLNQTISWEEVGRKDNENHLDPAAALHSVQLMKIDTYPHSPSSSPTLVFDQTKKKEHTEQKGRIHLGWNKKEMTKWEENFFEKGNSWFVEERKEKEKNLGQRVDEKCIRLILVPVSNIFCYGEFLIPKMLGLYVKFSIHFCM